MVLFSLVSNEFKVKIGLFEGPLDLILSLIEERKLLVSEISIAQVADDFIAYIESRGELPVREAANFVVVAATLLLLKSRALLPALSLTDEEQGDIRDLEWRLKIYQVFRDVAKGLAVSLSKSGRMFFGSGARIADPLFSPSADLSAESLREAALRAVEGAPKTTLVPEVSVKSVMSLEEMIEKLAERIERAVSLSFSDFAGRSVDRRELAVGFLALLELVKRGLVLVRQENAFGAITMDYNGAVGAPKFE